MKRVFLKLIKDSGWNVTRNLGFVGFGHQRISMKKWGLRQVEHFYFLLPFFYNFVIFGDVLNYSGIIIKNDKKLIILANKQIHSYAFSIYSKIGSWLPVETFGILPLLKSHQSASLCSCTRRLKPTFNFYPFLINKQKQ